MDLVQIVNIVVITIVVLGLVLLHVFKQKAYTAEEWNADLRKKLINNKLNNENR